MGDDKDKDQDIHVSVGGSVGGEMNVAGGDINRTTIGNVQGDVVQGDKVVKGDEVRGDKISVGDVSDSNVVIGEGNKQTVTQTNNQTTITNPFEHTRQAIQDLDIPDEDKQEAQEIVGKIEEQDKKDEPDTDRIDRYLGLLERVAPAAIELLVNAITNPGAAVGSGVRLAVQSFRASRSG